MAGSSVRRMIIPTLLACCALVTSACGNGSGSTTGTASTQSSTTSRPEPTEFAGYVRRPPLNVSDVTLPDVNGTPITMVADPGGLRLVYFGFGTCPDVCPATLGYVKMALAELPQADRERVQVDVISIDPTRDTPDRWEPYVHQFVTTANVIRSDDPYLLRSSAKQFGADYQVRLDEKGERQVSHTDDLYAIDDAGTIILAWPFGTAPIDIETDLRRLLAGERPADDA